MNNDSITEKGNLHPEFIVKIDWGLLREQKDAVSVSTLNDDVKPKHREALEGILSLIDSIQDYAVDVMGLTEVEVFGISDAE